MLFPVMSQLIWRGSGKLDFRKRTAELPGSWAGRLFFRIDPKARQLRRRRQVVRICGGKGCPMNRLDRYFAVLDLKPGVPLKDLRQAYRDLVKVWHPDRFGHEPRLQYQAQEKLKEINEAYAILRSCPTPARNWPVKPGAEPQKRQSNSNYQKGAFYFSPAGGNTSSGLPKWPKKYWGLLLPLSLGGLLLLMIAYVFASPGSIISLFYYLPHLISKNNYFSFILLTCCVLFFLFIESLGE